MMKLAIYPYKRGSQSARDLARALGVKRIQHKNSTFSAYNRITGLQKTVINWGSSSLPDEVMRAKVWNYPQHVLKASDKRHTLRTLTEQGLSTLEWTTDCEEAQGWADEGHIVVCRQTVNGHSGQGIILYDKQEDLDGVPHDHMGMIPPCPLYTKYIKKQDEYRLHVFNGEVIDIQQKKRRLEIEDDEVDWKIRNFDNGFTYAREGVEVDQRAITLAVRSCDALHLDFCAVDMLYNRHYDEYYVCEVNTAPGLTGTTLEKYVEAFRRIV